MQPQAASTELKPPPGRRINWRGLRLLRSPLEFITEAGRLGDMATLRVGFRTMYLLNSAEYVQQALVHQPEKLVKPPLQKMAMFPYVGEGILMADGDLHRRQRKLMQPAFHHKRIAAYGDIMRRHTQQMLDGWQGHSRVDIQAAITHLTMLIVTEALFQADVSGQAEQMGQAVSHAIERITESLRLRPKPPLWVPTPANHRLKTELRQVRQVLAAGIAERQKSGEDRGDLLSMLILARDEDGQPMDADQLLDEVFTLFAARHETTANALTWALYLLAGHPAEQARLHAELDAVLGGEMPGAQHLAALAFTDAVIQETMRLYPPVWIIGRTAVADLNVGGSLIKSGAGVLISPYTLHRRPAVFPEPERFDPQRFNNPERQAQIPRYAYLPFGAGPRVCIGNGFAMMEARLVLAAIMQRYQVSLMDGQDPITPEPLITLRPSGPVWVNVTARGGQTA